jgi:hypothetical protein
MEPTNMNKNGQHASISFEGKCDPIKSKWEAKGEFKLGGFKLGPINSWNELQFDTDNKNQHTLQLSQNLNYQNYHVAWKTILDSNTQ